MKSQLCIQYHMSIDATHPTWRHVSVSLSLSAPSPLSLPLSLHLNFTPSLHPLFLSTSLSPLQYVYVCVSLLWTILISFTTLGYMSTITCSTRRAVNLTCTDTHTRKMLPVMKQCLGGKKKSFYWNTKEKSGHGVEEIREACQWYFHC